MASGLAAIVPKVMGNGVVSAIRHLSTAWWAARFARCGRILGLGKPLTTAATRPSVMVYTSLPSLPIDGYDRGAPASTTAYRWFLPRATGTSGSATRLFEASARSETFIAVSSIVLTGLVAHARSIDRPARDAATLAGRSMRSEEHT